MTAIRVELQLADGTFTSGMLRAGQTIAQFNAQLARTNPAMAAIHRSGGNLIQTMDRADGSSKGFLATMRDLSIVTGVLSLGIGAVSRANNSFVGEIIRVNAEMQRMTIMMKSMARSDDPMKEAADNVKYLREQAVNMPFALDTLSNAFVKLQSTGIDPMNGSFQALADGVAAFGGSDEQFKRTTVAITQMSGKGVIQMEELRQQLGEHMPRAVELMARSMGVGVAQLIKEISTGTVAAKPALEAFYAELERTYGGRAKAMMQTFEGQLKQTQTLWQTLMTTVGGMQSNGTWAEGSFFTTITNELGELNRMLAEPIMTEYANQMGNALTSIVGFIKDAITTVIAFRREIGTVAVAAASAFAFTAAISGINSLRVAFGTMALEMQRARMIWATGDTWFAAAQGGFKSLQTAGMATQMTMIGLGNTIKAVGIGFMAVAPWIAAVGLAAYAAAEYFDVFGNKVRNAYEDLKTFGAESEAQARKAIDARVAQVNAEIKAQENLANIQAEMNGARDADLDNYVKELKAQRDEIESTRAALEGKGAQREDDKALSEYQRTIDDRLAAEKASYDEAGVAVQDHYDELLKKAKASGESLSEVETNRRKALFAEMVKGQAAEESFLRAEIARAEELSKGATGRLAAQLADQRRLLNTHLIQTIEKRKRLDETGASGLNIDTVAAPADGSAAIKRAETAVESLNKDVAGLKAELHGANGAYAEMQQAIANGDYGSVKEGGNEVAKLHEQLLAATKQKEILDALMKGRSDVERDTERERRKALEEQLDIEMEREEILNDRKFTGAEVIKWRIDKGWYEGMGDDEQVRTALDKIIAGFDDVGTTATETGQTISNDAFGQTAIDSINSVTAAAGRLRDMLLGVNSSAGAFPGLNAGAGAGGAAGVNGPMPDLQNLPAQITDRMTMAMQHMMKKGWSQTAAAGIVGNLYGESKMDPNAVGDNGKAFGMAQWNSRGPEMKAFLAAQGKQWNDFFGQLDFIDHEMRTSEKSAGDELKTAKTAAEAAQIVMRKYERPAAWAAVKSGPERMSAANQAMGLTGGAVPTQTTLPSIPMKAPELPAIAPATKGMKDYELVVKENVKATEEFVKVLDTTADVQKTSIDEKKVNERLRSIKELRAEIEAIGTDAESTGSALQAVTERIKLGELGDSKDPKAAEYTKLIATANELDAANKRQKEMKEAITASDADQVRLDEQRVKLNQQIADTQARMKDPNFVPQSSAMTSLMADLDAYVENMRIAYGTDSTLYKQALDTKTQMLQQQRQLEAGERGADIAKETQELQLGLLSETDARARAMQTRIAAVDAWVEQARAAGMEEVEITRQAEAAKAAIRGEFAQTTDPMTKQMQEWGDIQGNLAKASTQWMDSMAGGITDLIMGTGDLSSVINGIMKDMVNMMVKFAMSGMKGGDSNGGGNKKASKASTATTAATGGKKAMFGVAHTGGVLGQSTLRTRRASAAIFSGAPKYHTGGIVGPKLLPSEVPIIAKKGEGVFTEEQMSNLSPAGGGGQIVSINSPITVNASGGTPEQNNDLAKRMRREMEVGMRTVVADELRKQTKNGNMLNTRSR